MTSVAIVGAGPAGIRAAEVLVEAGVSPVMIDEGARAGGQAYRTPSPGLDLDMPSLLGSEADKYQRLHETFARLKETIDYRPGTTVWGVFDNQLYTRSADGDGTVPFDALILATGATDRTFPVRGWTKPGVFTLGGAQVLLKDQGCLIGRRVVFCGSSPLLYLAALQYRQMGAEIAAILDTSSLIDKARAFGDLAANLPTLRRGLGYMGKLRAAGVRMRHGVKLRAFEGADRVSGVTFDSGNGTTETISCDAVAYGFGLKPETQLAELAGCTLAYSADFRQWLPVADEDGRSSKGLYVAGDGATIGGADAAELSGALAAHALLQDHEMTISRTGVPAMRKQLARFRRFQRGLARAFAWPSQETTTLADDITLCRCENISVGDMRAALAVDLKPLEINRTKAITRCGMGRCQGRFCGLAAAELTASVLGRPLSEIGYLRVQAPVKPLLITPVESA